MLVLAHDDGSQEMTMTMTTHKGTELVKLDKVVKLGKKGTPANAKALKKAAEQFGLTGTGKLADQVAELRAEFGRREATGTPMEVCSECEEQQPEGIGDCPFCGAAPEEEVHKAEVVSIKEAWTAAQLDEAAAKITTLKHEGSAKWYEMGQKIAELHAAEAWKAGGYKNFKDFCQKSLKMSHTFAYAVMGVAKKFTLAEFTENGPTKLAMVLKAPEEDQPGLMEEAKAGASARQLKTKATEAAARAKAASKANGAAPPAREASGTKPPAPAKEPPKETRGRPAKEDRTITLLTKIDSGKVIKALWRTKRTPEIPEIPEWKDGAYAEIKLSDTVSIMIELLHDRKGEVCIGVTGQIVTAK